MIRLQRAGVPGAAAERRVPRPVRRHPGRASSYRPDAGESVVALASLDTPSAGRGAGHGAAAWSSGCCRTTRQNRDEFEIIALKDGDRVVGAVQLRQRGPGPGVHHQRRPAAALPGVGRAPAGPQRRRAWPGSGWPPGPARSGSAPSTRTAARRVRWWSPWPAATARCPGPAASSVKVSAYTEYPAKGRATGGVRCHRFLKGEDALVLAWAGARARTRRDRGGGAGGPAHRTRPPGWLRDPAAAAAGGDRRDAGVLMD